ncbi:hypothetical protein DKX38_016395 [Salix brachista]|uniref:Uncharacterized protein n=1 Tax=Salix brachista TaxID=2182728 RepID=A0A5N5L8C3_9ROSI|nr:hypothetical protein DKX38_016395 [Salix brachista]
MSRQNALSFFVCFLLIGCMRADVLQLPLPIPFWFVKDDMSSWCVTSLFRDLLVLLCGLEGLSFSAPFSGLVDGLRLGFFVGLSSAFSLLGWSLFGSQGYGTVYLSQEVKFAVTNDSTSTDTATSDQGGYVKGVVTYTVTDDLSVSPLSMVSVVILLNKLNIKDFGVLKEKVVEFGIDEGIKLLKASLSSKDALTAVFLLKDKDGAPVSN